MVAELRMDVHDDETTRNYFLLDTSSPDAVGRASFPLVRRGFDPIEVQGFARAVSAELDRLHSELAELRTSLADAEQRAAVGIDDDVVLQYLGEESARLIATARSTAQQARAKADDQAARLLAEAESAAHSTRAEAQTHAADVRKAAEQRAKETVGEGERNARSLVTSAKAESDEMIRRAEAHAERLIAEAEDERAQIIEDLARRRDALNRQVERLAGSRQALRALIGNVRLLADDSLEQIDAIPVGGEPVVEATDPGAQVTVVVGG